MAFAINCDRCGLVRAVDQLKGWRVVELSRGREEGDDHQMPFSPIAIMHFCSTDCLRIFLESARWREMVTGKISS